MRKLIILKSLVDFIWIVSVIPVIGLLLFFSVYIFINPDVIKLIFDSDSTQLSTGLWAKVFALILIISALIVMYCFYLFRKTLRYFQKVKPFHTDVIMNFNRIGILLAISGTLSIVILFIAQLVVFSKFKVALGLTPNVILICLGLFFTVLSEVFKVAKQAKEENELTI